jgi:hypothetical protein
MGKSSPCGCQLSCNTLLRTHSLSSIHEEGMIRPPAPAKNEYCKNTVPYSKVAGCEAVYCFGVFIPHFCTYFVHKQQLMKTKMSNFDFSDIGLDFYLPVRMAYHYQKRNRNLTEQNREKNFINSQR